MHTVILWCGFFGSWLLFAGPVYQAALELQEEDFERDTIAATVASIQTPAPISPWWWLLPPVAYWLRRQRGERYRAAVMAQLTAEQRESLVHYINKATGWIFVGGGGFLLAVAETWDLTETEDWPIEVFWALAVVMSALSALHAVLRLRRTQRVVKPT
jgi:hypothetical protein